MINKQNLIGQAAPILAEISALTGTALENAKLAELLPGITKDIGAAAAAPNNGVAVSVNINIPSAAAGSHAVMVRGVVLTLQ